MNRQRNSSSKIPKRGISNPIAQEDHRYVISKISVFFLTILFSFSIISCSTDDTGRSTKEDEDKQEAESYQTIILNDEPVGFWPLDYDDIKEDSSKNKEHGKFKGSSLEKTKLPNGDEVNIFNGKDNYFEIPAADHLKLIKTGVLTIEVWMRPDVLNFEQTEKDKDYIYWMGQGEPNQHSWTFRMYNKDSWRENRPNRISGYAFNLEGGLGAGSYFQDDDIIPEETWLHIVLIINTKETDKEYPTGYTKLYRDGVLRDQDDLKSYDIKPGNSQAPIRIGTRDKKSFFQGAVAKVALYDYELSNEAIKIHFKNMTDE